MFFKSFIGAVSVCLTVASFNVSALPIGITDNGDYSRQSIGGSTIDWLDLSFTANQRYDDALATASGLAGGGWSYASATQVESLLDTLFAGVTYNVFGYASLADSVYAPEFVSLFGATYADASTEFSYGLYEDEAGILRMGGALNQTGAGTADLIYGPNFTGTYDRDGTNPAIGTYLVRSTTVDVPEPSIAILMASGLVVFGLLRRKSRV